MKRYILTGTPGSGKTSLIRSLELQGYAVVEEAATAIIALEQTRGIAKPWEDAAFVDNIIRLQRQRQQQTTSSQHSIQFYDRSPLCTLALSRYLQYLTSDLLADEIERITREHIYERRVFFIRSLGFCAPTSARTITQQQAEEFEQVHWEVYRSYGYECIDVPPGSVDGRRKIILQAITDPGFAAR